MDLFEILLAKKLGGNGGGGITPSGTKDINANGNDIDVYSFAKVNVNVPNPSTGKVNITTTSEVNVTNYATAQVVDSDLIASNIKKDVNILGVTGTYEGGGGGDIWETYLPKSESITISSNTITELGAYALYYAENKNIFITLNLPNLTKIADSALHCLLTNEELILPYLTSFGRSNGPTSGSYTYQDGLKSFRAPNLTGEAGGSQQGFGYRRNLQLVDLGNCTKLGNTLFAYSGVKVVILRNTDSVVTLGNATQVWDNSPGSPTGDGITVYVPESMLSSYQRASAWQTFLGRNAYNQIKKLEGSPYENVNFVFTPIV